VKGDTYGTFKFKIKAVDNPVIRFELDLNDVNNSFEKVLISFKKNRLGVIYCGALADYFDQKTKTRGVAEEPYVSQAENVCTRIGDDFFVEKAKNYYLKHQQV
jgi:hypothetical protein